MRILLDTHAFIWWDGAPQRLSPKSREIIANPDNEPLLSVVSIWEMQIKSSLGKLALRHSVRGVVEEQTRNAVSLLPIRPEHIFKLGELAPGRQDPFDRLLAAQALEEGLTVVTKDDSFAKHGVSTIW